MTDPFGLPLVAKATLVLLLALGTVAGMRRARAARRALVLAAAFAVLLALPVASIVAPPVGIDIPAPAAGLSLDRAPALDPTPPIVQGADPAPPPSPGVVALDLAPSVEVPPAPMFQVQAILRTAWVAGAALVLVPFLLALWRLHTLARTALPWPEGAPLVARLCVESGIRRHIALGVHERVHAPITFGLVHPIVLLPPDARDWPEHDRQRALVHELEHVRRLDWLVYLVARTACALYWFHPLVWIAWRRLCLDTERACDDAVLGRSESDVYARQLVSLAQRLSSASDPVVGMASRTDLAARVRAILNLHQARGRAGLPAAAGVACSACLLLALIGPLQATAPVTVAGDGPPAVVHTQPTPAAVDNAPPGPALAILESQVRTPGTVPSSIVASIRRSTSAARRAPGHGGTIERLADGRLVARGVTIFDLVRYAYGLDSRQPVAGAREWLDLRFDVEITPGPATGARPGRAAPARMEGGTNGYVFVRTPLGEEHWMMQALLEERFQLSVQFATREVAHYRAVMAHDGIPGPGLRPSTLDCGVIQAMRERGERPQPPAGYERAPLCGFHGTSGAGGMELVGTGVSVPRLIQIAFAGSVRAPIADATGLTGTFDVNVRSGPPPAGQSWDAWRAAVIESHLGLRLEIEPGTTHVIEPFQTLDAVRIEHVAMPADL